MYHDSIDTISSLHSPKPVTSGDSTVSSKCHMSFASDICILKILALACVKLKRPAYRNIYSNTVKIPGRRKWPLVKPVKRVEAEKLEHAMVHSSLLTVPLPWSQILHLYPVIVWLLKKFPVFYMEWRKNTCHYRQHVGRTLLTQY